MEKTTLKALQGSIKKWKGIVNGTAFDEGTLNCPLCDLFYSQPEFAYNACKGCPVSDATSRPYCIGSPYIKWEVLRHIYDSNKAINQEMIESAQEEVDFLVSLLPES